MGYDKIDAKGRMLVQVRLSERIVKDVDHISIEWGTDRGKTLERLLREAIAGRAVG